MDVERLGFLQLGGISRWGCNSMGFSVGLGSFSPRGKGSESSRALGGFFFLERWVSWMRLATSFRGDRISLLFK